MYLFGLIIDYLFLGVKYLFYTQEILDQKIYFSQKGILLKSDQAHWKAGYTNSNRLKGEINFFLPFTGHLNRQKIGL